MHGTLGPARRIFLTTDAVGGVWRYSMALAAGFTARGWRCTLATMGPAPSAGQRHEVARLPLCTLLDTGLPLDWTAQRGSELASAAQKLQFLARRAGAETVHLHSASLAAYPWILPVVAVAHSCVGTWWHALHDQPAPADFRWRMDLMRTGLQSAAAIIAPSQAVAGTLKSIYAVTRPIHVVHNGLEAAAHSAQPRQRRVLTAARLWDRGKNMEILDKAAALLDAPVQAAGPQAGPDGAQLKFANLKLLGNLSATHLRNAMASAAIFAAPSLYEPFGLAVLEAAQLGTPLVLASNPTFRELWDGAAVFADPHDHRAWADILGGLLDSGSRRAEYGALAQIRSRRYTADEMVTATLAIHRTVALETV